jgi:hypothetical protein
MRRGNGGRRGGVAKGREGHRLQNGSWEEHGGKVWKKEEKRAKTRCRK